MKIKLKLLLVAFVCYTTPSYAWWLVAASASSSAMRVAKLMTGVPLVVGTVRVNSPLQASFTDLIPDCVPRNVTSTTMKAGETMVKRKLTQSAQSSKEIKKKQGPGIRSQ